jgi:16S rRNA (guanine(1405)-N(7))-methyltransferase
MPADSDPQLDALVRTVLASPKYRTVCEETVRHVGRHELRIRKTLKAAARATRNTLHQAAGAFAGERMRYAVWETELRNAGDRAAVQAVCRRVLEAHASTRERLRDVETLYAWVFSQTGPVHAILDIGCGLNPLAIPWMPVTPSVRYEAYDIFTDLAEFLNRFFRITGQNGQAFAQDVTIRAPASEGDLALMLKLLPALDHLPGGDGLRLLRAVRAPWIAVSFPVASLGGREKGMADYYAAHFQTLVAEEPWSILAQRFPSELVFLVDKRKALSRQPVTPPPDASAPPRSLPGY